MVQNTQVCHGFLTNKVNQSGWGLGEGVAGGEGRHSRWHVSVQGKELSMLSVSLELVGLKTHSCIQLYELYFISIMEQYMNPKRCIKNYVIKINLYEPNFTMNATYKQITSYNLLNEGK